jgi:hypothetical protein
MYNTSQQFRRLLHANLSIEVYRVRNATVRLGITHREGSIFVDDNTKNVYISKINTFPYHSLTSLIAGNYLIKLGGDKTLNDTMFKTVYDIDNTGAVDISESLTITGGTITGDELLALITTIPIARAGRKTLVIDTPSSFVFDTAFTDTNYSLTINCYDTSGYMVGYTLTGKTRNGFVIEASADCTAEYSATPYISAP